MTEYEKKIAQLATDKTPEIFYNSSESHAKVVLNCLFENAENYVYSICGNMCSEVSNNEDYIRNVEKFLSGDISRQFFILFDSFNEDFLTSRIAGVLSRFPKQVKIRRFINSSFFYYNGKRAHLAISDDRAFRLETDVDQKVAIGNFNDIINVTFFNRIFKEYFTDKYSRVINLPVAEQAGV